jgi:quercetin dioxygenase-like cupin family protein
VSTKLSSPRVGPGKISPVASLTRRTRPDAPRFGAGDNRRNRLIGVLSVLTMTTISNAAGFDRTDSMHGRDLSAVLPMLPADHPVGSGATVTLVSLERATNLHEPALSTFVVDYAPGASAMLHRIPSSGYVLVHVLSGTIRALAGEASVGIYRAGETWAEPAFANNIGTTNGSTREPARGARCPRDGRRQIPGSRRQIALESGAFNVESV